MKKGRLFYSIFGRSISTMIVSSFIFVMMIPIIIICVYAYLHLSGNIKTEYSKTVTQLVTGIDKNIDIYFTEIRKTTDGIFASQSVQQLLIEANHTKIVDPKLESDTMDYIYAMYGGRGDISCISIYSKDALICEKNFAHLKKMHPGTDEIIAKLSQNNGAFTIFGTRYQMSKDSYHMNVLTVGRMIKNLETGEEIGYLIIDLDYGMFKKIIGFTKENNLGTLLIVNDRDEIIYNSNHDQEMLKKYDETEFYQTMKMQREYQDVVIKGAHRDWTYHMLSDGEEMLHELNKIARRMLLLGILTLLSFLIIAILIAQGVSKPINHLEKAMERAEKSNFNEIIPAYTTYGEVNRLIRRYNVMQVEIKRLLEKEKQLHKKQAETEYKALQMQITPHFLYNALDTINCLAQIHNEPEISEMIIGLGDIFKYNVKYDFRLVTLQDEIEHVKNYGLLQAIRYQENFQIQYEVEEEFKTRKVTKFMLQPLVENAIQHGMKQVAKDGIIRIWAKEDEHYFYVVVEDNGQGMEEDEAIRLRQSLKRDSHDIISENEEKDKKEKKHGVGIMNVNLRLKLQYGENAGIDFETVKGEGMKMFVMIPLKQEAL